MLRFQRQVICSVTFLRIFKQFNVKVPSSKVKINNKPHKWVTVIRINFHEITRLLKS